MPHHHNQRFFRSASPPRLPTPDCLPSTPLLTYPRLFIDSPSTALRFRLSCRLLSQGQVCNLHYHFSLVKSISARLLLSSAHSRSSRPNCDFNSLLLSTTCTPYCFAPHQPLSYQHEGSFAASPVPTHSSGTKEDATLPQPLSQIRSLEFSHKFCVGCTSAAGRTRLQAVSPPPLSVNASAAIIIGVETTASRQRTVFQQRSGRCRTQHLTSRHQQLATEQKFREFRRIHSWLRYLKRFRF